MNSNTATSKNGYALSRQWFNFTAETSEMVSTIHTALYFWIVDLNNRLNWKEVIGLPTDHTMNAIRIKSYRSYKRALDDLCRWGFLTLVTKARNQHTCNEVALVLKTKAEAKAEAKAKQAYINSTNDIKPLETPKEGLSSKLLNLFLEVHGSYVVTDLEKEQEAANKLLSIFETNTPGLEPDDILSAMRYFFEKCINIPDNWLRPQMSLPIIVKYFNRIKSTLEQPPKEQGATWEEIAAIMANKYGTDRPMKPGTSPDLRNVDSDNYLNEQ